MKGVSWFTIFLVVSLALGILAGCAGTDGSVTGTRSYLRDYGNYSDKPRLNLDSPTFWTDYLNSQGGG